MKIKIVRKYGEVTTNAIYIITYQIVNMLGMLRMFMLNNWKSFHSKSIYNRVYNIVNMLGLFMVNTRKAFIQNHNKFQYFCFSSNLFTIHMV